MKKITTIENGVYHKHEKYQFQIFCIFELHKNNKSVKFEDLKICILRSTLLLFLRSVDIGYLELIFCMFVGYTIGYIHYFSQKKIETRKYFSQFF